MNLRNEASNLWWDGLYDHTTFRGNWKMKLNHLCLRWQTRMDRIYLGVPSLHFWKPDKYIQKRTNRNHSRMSPKPLCFTSKQPPKQQLNLNTTTGAIRCHHPTFHLIQYGNLRGCTIAEQVLWVTGSLKNAWFPVLCIIWDTLYPSMALLTW